MDEQLINAIESRDIERVKALLAAGANPNVKKGDETAYELARYGPDEIKCALIEAGADDASLRHSLVWAVMTNRVETVKVLLDKGSNINVSTYSGSPLEQAARTQKGQNNCVLCQPLINMMLLPYIKQMVVIMVLALVM
ncbi:ankyrin repeat domain-containing protein [Nostoc sp. FACHB-152]|uniref:ankyrin repeat domain-containing protein n=1 Tax=unclassified Nostoc TaxID=2593658 RepID=UPI0016846623|nr:MULTISPECIES: ankyrin repeat domain-containing protein [unclassified Nostoc]MBD2446693.1 ankyrin repeat domain-containing protein [Nostoc sp. FACHB-152]MBD2466541.1 ankyrin repeat domain-containing protein [Nostoc sp. FACHB-145]